MAKNDVQENKNIRVFYIIGDDPIARIKESNVVVDEILGSNDRSLALESFDLSDSDSDDGRNEIIDRAITSLMSPPFLTEIRVIVIRDIGGATKENIDPLVKYFQDMTQTSYLVMVQGGGRILPTLTKAFKPISIQRGQQSEQIPEMYARLVRENKFKFEPGVRKGAEISVKAISPFLGEAGTGPIYELANYICSGNSQSALETVSRLMNSTSITSIKAMHPLQIVSLLANHFRKLAILDSPDINNKDDAHLALGSKGKPYGSQKLWELSRRLGSKRILQSIIELGNADVSIKGETAIDGQIVIELLVISLCKICA